MITNARNILDCGGKRSATPLWRVDHKSKAPSPLRSAGAVQEFPYNIELSCNIAGCMLLVLFAFILILSNL